MAKFQLFAQPWWVNLLIAVPGVVYLQLRRKSLRLPWRQMLMIGAFALAFGFVEAAVVVYLRAASSLLPGYNSNSLGDIRRWSMSYQQTQSNQLPQGLLTIEVMREAATMVMLVCVAVLAASRPRERWASFLLAFAIWDISYYAGLWTTVGWPSSIKDLDVLFLIPVPWFAQVWYPLLVSALTLLVLTWVKLKPGNAGSGK